MSLERIEEAIEKIAFIGAVIGAGIGAGRKKDKGEDRSSAIGRSALTGLATDFGGGIGSIPGAILHHHHIATHGTPSGAALGLMVGGHIAGRVAAYHLAKRKEKKKR